MNRLVTFALVTATFLGTAGVVARSGFAGSHQTIPGVRLTADGAFRDGLYQGRLAAERGSPLRPSNGRWASEKDRESFEAGYRLGYNDSVASATPKATPAMRD